MNNPPLMHASKIPDAPLAGRINPVIVNYRTPDLVIKCVTSILHFGIAQAADIIVVENASPDDSYQRLRAVFVDDPAHALHGVQLIQSPVNGGYGAGVNLGANACRHELILVLNPDTYFEDRSISQALETFDQCPEVGLIGLDLIYPSGRRQYSARRFYSLLDIIGRRLPFGDHWPLKSYVDRHMMKSAWKQGLAFEAEWVMGTGFLIRRNLYVQLGGMDETYFLYMEDVDLCARVWQAGYRIVCIPEVKLVHDHQRSSKAGPFSPAGRMHLQSLLLFRRKFRVPIFFAPGLKGLKRPSAQKPIPVQSANQHEAGK